MKNKKHLFLERGRFLFKERWYSICSVHHQKTEDCKACNTGQWSNIYLDKIESLIYKMAPGIWRWWVNRPNSKSMKFLKKVFYNMKNKT